MKEPRRSEIDEPQLPFELWVEEHSDYLFRYAYRYFRNQELAEDLVQDTFLAALAAQDRFEGRSAPRTWLVAILRHKIIDRMRISGREVQVAETKLDRGAAGEHFNEVEHWTIPSGPRSWGAHPDAALEQKEFMGVLERCLSKVPEGLRQLFLLRELEGLSRGELAEQFNLTANNVGVILYRVRLSLQSCLQVNWLSNQEE